MPLHFPPALVITTPPRRPHEEGQHPFTPLHLPGRFPPSVSYAPVRSRKMSFLRKGGKPAQHARLVCTCPSAWESLGASLFSFLSSFSFLLSFLPCFLPCACTCVHKCTSTCMYIIFFYPRHFLPSVLHRWHRRICKVGLFSGIITPPYPAFAVSLSSIFCRRRWRLSVTGEG